MQRYSKCTFTAQKMKFSIKDFLSKCNQICGFLRIKSHLLKKSLMENFIFCVVLPWDGFLRNNKTFYLSINVFSYEIFLAITIFFCDLFGCLFMCFDFVWVLLALSGKSSGVKYNFSVAKFQV